MIFVLTFPKFLSFNVLFLHFIMLEAEVSGSWTPSKKLPSNSFDGRQ